MDMDTDMDTKLSVLVTGSSSGFGDLIARTLARQGYAVFAGIREAAGRNADAAASLQTLANTENLALRVVDLDVTDDASVAAAVRAVIAATGRLDVVVNNAGVAYTGPLEAFTADQVREQFEVNVFGVLRMNRAALPQMRAQGSGLLIQISSIVGRLAFPFTGLYGATKFAIEGLTESYRYELAPLGIDAAAIEPGLFPTRISENRVNPADGERVGPYMDALGSVSVRFFADLATAPPDPQMVADAVAHLIATPAGQRPLRTVVALEHQAAPTRALNADADRAQRAYLDMLGVTDLVTLPAREGSAAR